MHYNLYKTAVYWGFTARSASKTSVPEQGWNRPWNNMPRAWLSTLNPRPVYEKALTVSLKKRCQQSTW